MRRRTPFDTSAGLYGLLPPVAQPEVLVELLHRVVESDSPQFGSSEFHSGRQGVEFTFLLQFLGEGVGPGIAPLPPLLIALAPSDIPATLIAGYPLPLSGLRIDELPLAVELYRAEDTHSAVGHAQNYALGKR